MPARLTDQQLVILNAAMQYTDGVVCLPKKKGADMRAFSSGVLSLEKRGFLERCALTQDPTSYILNSATPRCSFQITNAGQMALNASPEDDAPKVSRGAKADPPARKAKAVREKKVRAKKEPRVDADGNPIEVARRGVMVATYHSEYMANGGGCGDNVDSTMRDAFTETVTEKTKTGKDRDVHRTDAVALEKWGRKIDLWNDNWSALNVGMRRMNLANRVRGAIRKGIKIVLDGTTLTVG